MEGKIWRVKVLSSLTGKLVLGGNWRTVLLDLAKLIRIRAVEEHFFSVPKCRQKKTFRASQWMDFSDSKGIPHNFTNRTHSYVRVYYSLH